MAITYLVGGETGDVSEMQTVSGSFAISASPLKHGAYAFRANPSGAATGYGIFLPGAGLNAGTICCKFDFYITTAPGSNEEYIVGVGDASGAVGAEEFHIRLTSSRTLHVLGADVSDVATGSTALNTATWYAISFSVVNSDTGAYEVKINGSTELSGTGDFRGTAGSSNTTHNRIVFGKYANLNSQTIDVSYDSIVVGNDTTHPDDETIVIARSPATGGTPSVDTWTKSTGTDAGALWNDTPFNTGDSCVSPGSGDPLAQTADIATFASTQTGHGSETIASGDTVVGVQAVVIAKRSTGGGRTHDVRYKLGANAAVDTAVTLATGDGIYWSTLAASPAYADINTAEIGGEKSGGAAGQSMTIEDGWLMAAYIFVDPGGGGGLPGLAGWNRFGLSGSRGLAA